MTREREKDRDSVRKRQTSSSGNRGTGRNLLGWKPRRGSRNPPILRQSQRLRQNASSRMGRNRRGDYHLDQKPGEGRQCLCKTTGPAPEGPVQSRAPRQLAAVYFRAVQWMLYKELNKVVFEARFRMSNICGLHLVESRTFDVLCDPGYEKVLVEHALTNLTQVWENGCLSGRP